MIGGDRLGEEVHMDSSGKVSNRRCGMTGWEKDRTRENKKKEERNKRREKRRQD